MLIALRHVAAAAAADVLAVGDRSARCAQIAATALMLAAMNDRSFVVSIAYIKTEPVQVALFGLVFLGDAVTLAMAAAILIATAGVVHDGAQARRTSGGPEADAARACRRRDVRAFGGRLSRRDPEPRRCRAIVMAATFTLVVGLVLQAVLLSLYLWLRDPEVLVAIVRAWRPSLFAGFMGALASQFWFLAFALATAASVRTLALVEVLFAQAISRFVFKQPTTAREALGIVLIVIGVALLLWAHVARVGRVMRAENRVQFGQPSVPLVRQHRQRMELDAFLVQFLGLLRRGLAVDRAVLDLAVVHLARFFGKFLADIVGILGEVVAQFLELRAELALLRRHHGDRRVASGAAAGAARRLGRRQRCGALRRASSLPRRAAAP